MSVSQIRPIVQARRTAGDRVAAALQPAENFAQLSAINSARLVSIVLEIHAEVHLPPDVGMEALTLLSEASHFAAQSRAKMGAAHVLLRQVAANYNIVHAGPPDCPPNVLETIIPSGA